jgi:hypothetical protein
MGVLAPLMIKTSLAKLTLSCKKPQFLKEFKNIQIAGLCQGSTARSLKKSKTEFRVRIDPPQADFGK